MNYIALKGFPAPIASPTHAIVPMCPPSGTITVNRKRLMAMVCAPTASTENLLAINRRISKMPHSSSFKMQAGIAIDRYSLKSVITSEVKTKKLDLISERVKQRQVMMRKLEVIEISEARPRPSTSIWKISTHM